MGSPLTLEQFELFLIKLLKKALFLVSVIHLVVSR